MFTLEQQQSLDWIDKYLAETPPEVIQAEVDRISNLQFEGPTVAEYFDNFHKAFILQDSPLQEETKSLYENRSLPYRVYLAQSSYKKYLRATSNKISTKIMRTTTSHSS